MQNTIFPILAVLACMCLLAAVTRLRSRQRSREKRLTDSFAAAIRSGRI
jgi:hypothetical protein